VRSALRDALKKFSFEAFLALDRVGLHVLPKHYYTPIPDYRWLRENRSAWLGRSPMTGVRWDLDEQLRWLRVVTEKHAAEVAGLSVYRELAARGAGPGYGPIESQVLHCAVRALLPETILEIGGGISTQVSLYAAAMNRKEGRPASRMICVEPYPRPALRALSEITLVEKTCQAAPASTFDALKSGDLLFIDSSHAVALGSDVVKIFLDIIPRLRAGVYIHIHDIYLPYLYHRTPLSDYFAPQETALLLALLTDNPRLEILACLSGLHYDRPAQLKALLPDYVPQANDEGMAVPGGETGHFPSSIYLRVKR